jgi:PAS domain S-box-containing protein
MSIGVAAQADGIGARDLKPLATALVIAISYYVAAEAAFFIGTLSDEIFAPFWPPNTVLLCALLIVSPGRWWLVFASAFPAHVIAEYGIGMDTTGMLVAFATNGLFAGGSAWVLRKTIGVTSIFDTTNSTAAYILITALAASGLVAFGGAFVPIFSGGALKDYWLHWQQWFASNALGSVTLSPLAIIALVSRRKSWFGSTTSRERLDALLTGMLLVVICAVAFRPNTFHISRVYLPALLYLPLPVVAWAAIRFGMRGASMAIMIVTIVLIWRALNGPGPFVATTPEESVFAMQIFLIALSLLVLLLGAAIDETRRASRLTKESEERMAIAAAGADTGIWQYHGDSGDFWLTDHCRQMFGFDDEQHVTREALLSAVHPEDREGVSEVLHNLDREDVVEFRVPLRDGTVPWYRLRARPHPRTEGDPVLVSGLVANVSERKEAEAEAALQRQEIAHLMRVSMLGELSGGLAHELTQPLTAILSNAQAARAMIAVNPPDLTDLADTLDDIISEDNRAGEVVHRLRNLMRKGEAKFEAVDPKTLVLSTLRLLNSELVGRRILAHVDLQPDIASVSGDPIQLQQILLNLILNAAEAVSDVPPARRRIFIGARSIDDERIEIFVRDQGLGMTPSQINQAFQPFFTTKERGLGLGLVICSTIAKLHGGSIELANSPNGGLTARLLLPRDNVEARMS